MHIKPMLAIPICLFGVFVFRITGSNGLSPSNLTEECYRCLCHVATQCDLGHGCTGGYCGPFNITRIFSIDSMKDLGANDWKDCAKTYECAKTIIEGYLQKFTRDCNGDGVTDCFDHMMVIGNGGYACSAPLNRSENGRRWLKRYAECRL